MLNDQQANGREEESDDAIEVREIHELTPPQPSVANGRARRREAWETSSHRSSTLSVGSEVLGENFTSMSREFNAMVVAGSTMQNDGGNDGANPGINLGRIGENDQLEETNPLAIVPDNNPMPSPRRSDGPSSSSVDTGALGEELSLHRVKKEEVETKISAWQTAEIAKINNRFKRQDAIINGWESEQIEKATTWLKKIERKLDEKRARAIEKMQNDVAKARRKSEEKRASAEAKRGTKVARILELTNFMRAVGRAPSKRSFF